MTDRIVAINTAPVTIERMGPKTMLLAQTLPGGETLLRRIVWEPGRIEQEGKTLALKTDGSLEYI